MMRCAGSRAAPPTHVASARLMLRSIGVPESECATTSWSMSPALPDRVSQASLILAAISPTIRESPAVGGTPSDACP